MLSNLPCFNIEMKELTFFRINYFTVFFNVTTKYFFVTIWYFFGFHRIPPFWNAKLWKSY